MTRGDAEASESVQSPGPEEAAPIWHQLTWSQQLLWTGQQLHPKAPLYNMVLAFELMGPLSADRFEQAFRSVVDRSDALRSEISARNGAPRLRVRDRFDAPVEHADLAASSDPDGEARTWMEARAKRLFAHNEPLFDCALLRLSATRHIWYLNQHHLITDAWSTGLVFRYVADAYIALDKAIPEDIPPLPAYSDFARHLRDSEGSGRLEMARAHWQAVEGNALPQNAMYGTGPLGFGGHSTQTERTTIALGAERSTRLRALATTPAARALTEHASRFNVFAALVLGFCARASGQRDVALGAPAHNRPTAPFKKTIGVFIEVFPLRADVDPEASFDSLLESVRKHAASFLRYATPGASSGGINRSVNVVLNYINATFPDFAGLATRSEWIHSGHGDASHDLRVQVQDFDDDDEFVVHLDLATDRFSPSQRALICRHFVTFVDSVLARPSAPLQELALIDAAENRELLTRFSRSSGDPRTTAEPPASVLSLVREQVRAHPTRIAVESGEIRWSYEELYRRAIRIAKALSAFEVRGRAVALPVPRSAEAVAAILGILEAGAAYIPLDPDTPPDRAQHMLAAADAVVAIVQEHGQLASDLPTFLVDEAMGSDRADSVVAEWIEDTPAPGPTDLAYVLFTSGSTGRPKGVQVEHSALANYATWAASQYLAEETAKFALFTPLTFDLTVTSIFAPLIAGGTVVVYPDRGEAVDTSVLEVFDDDAVDVVKLTPSHLALVLDRPEPLTRIQTLVVGGEDLLSELAASAQSMLGPDGRVINEFGPTEATVACTWHMFDPSADSAASVPIGRPIPGAHLSLVDGVGRLVPTGVVGEIVIGGRGVARGYLDESQTSERFVSDPVDPNGRAYRSGDLGRWRPDGTLEFRGRADRQIKVHGVRIEPAEIEAVLSEHEGVHGTTVVAVRTGIQQTEAVRHCVRCGMPSDHPEASVGDDGVCSLCAAFEGYHDRASEYFGTMGELEEVLGTRGRIGGGEFDCLLMLSGGKDSTYALCKLVEMGLRVRTVTLDNGYISEGAKANVRRVTEHLGVPHTFLTSDVMNELFVDSLERFSNVCQGCFKTMYTLAFNFALEHGIPSIVTGLSRGQFFETRLTEELFLGEPKSRKGLELVVLDARKAYHRFDDAVNRALDTDALQNDEAFERVAFVDFYRYCDVELDDMLEFLTDRVPWIRPDDTGRSTNCLINDVGIYVHKLERGFHNYALPYSWDVRLGHKERDAALEELDDDIDTARVQQILDEIGYVPKVPAGSGPDSALRTAASEAQLTAFIAGPAADRPQELKGFLKTRLPTFMIPSRFVRVDEIPLTDRGKVDTEALENLAMGSGFTVRDPNAALRAPESTAEIAVARLWRAALGHADFGVDSNFFELGGDSITAIRIAARAAAQGLQLTPNDLFRHQTVGELALVVEAAGAVKPSRSQPDPTPQSESLDSRTLDQVSALLRRADRSNDS